MKNKIIINIYFILFLVINNVAFAQSNKEVNENGYNKFYYANGNISSEGVMRNGRPDGYWKTYSLNGKIKSEGNRKEFQLDSLWKFYNGEGKLITEIQYVDGKKTGIKKSWDPDGFIMLEEQYVLDVKQGITFSYFNPNDSSLIKGKVRTETPFDKGKEHGISYEYDTAGKIITIREYNYGVLKKQQLINRHDKNGEKHGAWKEFYENGKVKEELTYFNGKKSGYAKKYTPTGSLVSIDKYEGDSLLSEAPELTTNLEVRNEYYENGSIKKTGTYLFGLAEGTHKEYSPEGKITHAKLFSEDTLIGEGLIDEAGNQQGPWVEYHGSGLLKAKGEYVNGARVDEWMFYFPNGKIEQKGRYDKKGRPQGLWKWYYPNGNELREESYLNGKREGALTEWNDSGKVITRGEYIEGMKEGKWFYEIQDYREEGLYKNDQKDGPWESYYVDNGRVRHAGRFIEGFPDGKHSMYFHDGRLSEEGKYVMGNKNGKWQYFNPDGTLLLSITFKNNREVKYDGVKVKPLLPGEGKRD